MKIVRRIILFMCLCLAQVCIYILAIEAGYSYWTKTGHYIRPDMSWGITVWISYYIFAVTGIVSAAFHSFNSKYRWLSTWIVFILYGCFYWFPQRPYRSALLLMSCFTALSLPGVALEIFRRLRRTHPTSETLLDTNEENHPNT